MKRIICLILISLVPLMIFSISRTITIDENIMNTMRNPDAIISQYLGIDLTPTNSGQEDSIFVDRNLRINALSINCSYLARDAIQYVIVNDPTNQQDIQNIIAKLDNSIYFCPHEMIPQTPGDLGGNQPIPLNPIEGVGSMVHLIYNSGGDYRYIDDIPASGHGSLSTDSLSEYDRTCNAMFCLTFLSFTYDMLFYAMTPEQRVSIGAKIQVFSDYLYNYLTNPALIGAPANYWMTQYLPFWTATSDTHSFVMTGGRVIQLPCAVGYSRIVLGKTMQDPALNWAVSILRDTPIVGNKNGLLSLLTRTSGFYTGGSDYSSQTMTGCIPIFFTALKRMQNINLWNNRYVISWLSYYPKMLKPNYHTLSTEDCWIDSYPGAADGGMLEYFYQNVGDIQGKSNIAWYIHRLKTINGNNWPHTKNAIMLNTDFSVVYSFNANCEVPITQDINPTFIEDGVYSDPEYTQLSSPLSNYGGNADQSIYKNRLWLFVNHENSFEHFKQHTKDEKGQFTLSFMNNMLIPEAGYRLLGSAWGITNAWYNSCYSKNMIVVNPDLVDESHYIINELAYPPVSTSLIRKSPVSETKWFNYDASNQIVDPCKKDYIFTNYNAKHVKMEIHIDDVEPAINAISGEANIERNFYSFADEIVIVHDNVTALTNPVRFRCQLHFNPSPWTIQYNDVTNIFCEHDQGNSKYLYGTMGALTLSSKTVDGFDSNFPIGLPSPNSIIGHKRYRVDTNNCNSNSFLTLLLPRTSSNNPIISTLDTEHSYITYANTITGYQLYSGISSLGREVINNVAFSTNAPFYAIEANNTFSNLRKMVINHGDFLTVRDVNASHFGTVHVFKSETLNVEEYIAEWTNNNLYVTCRNQTMAYPKYKILRCGVSPANFHSRTNYGTINQYAWPNNRFDFSNIQRFAYDDMYFYINYSFADLRNEAPTNVNLVLEYGNYDDLYDIDRDLLIGSSGVSVDGNMVIHTGSSVVLLDNAVLTIHSGSFINVGGCFSASSSQIISDTGLWGGFIVGERGSLSLNHCEVMNAENAITCYGTLRIQNSHIHNGMNGLYISRPVQYVIEHCEIDHFTGFGVRVIDAYLLATKSFIKYTSIHDNEVGMFCFNSTPYLENVSISHNLLAGLWTSHNAAPVVTKCTFSDNAAITQDYPEIFLDSQAYPVFQEKNNIIPASNGYSIYYQRYPAEPQDMQCINNYWGLDHEADIRATIFPDANIWHVDVSPFLTDPINGYVPIPCDSKFYQALEKEKENKISEALPLYVASILEDKGNEEEYWSLEHVIHCIGQDSVWTIEQTYDYMRAIADTCSDPYITSLSKQLQSYCARMLSDYGGAILGYEICMQNYSTDVDSLCFMLDIIHTFEEAQRDSIKSAGAYINVMGMHITNLKEMKRQEDFIMNQMKKRLDGAAKTIPSVSHIILDQNYPNPFNPETKINFAILDEGNVTLDIYNIRGQKVKTLTNQQYAKGKHTLSWDGKDNRGKQVSSGVYLYRLNMNGKNASRKMLLMK